jgi:signal transduction histidine kinase
MEKITQYIQKQFDIKQQAKELGVPLWQAPSLLFLGLGIIIIVLMYLVYVSSQFSQDPFFLIAAESIVVISLLFVGGFVIHSIEQMARANKTKSEFISIASHQMKSPLVQMRWLLDSINFSTVEEKEKYEKKFFLLQQSNESMLQLMNDLFDIARIDRGENIVRTEHVDIVEMIALLVEKYQVEAKRESKKLIFSNAMKKEEKEICIDRRRIGVALDNLIQNALQYTQHGGRVDVSIQKDIQRKSFQICVKDNGIGVPENEQYYIFQRFFRASNGKKLSVNGTGLGLYLTKSIVEQSGGKIWFRSIEGSGSLFCISLPLMSNCQTYGKQ